MGEEIQRWFDKAKDDLKKARDNFEMGNYDLTSYLCQQAIEKSLKSVLIKRTKSFPKIHDLVKLGKSVKLNKDLLEGCKRLNSVYIESRYPDVSSDKFTKEESQEDIKITEEILEWAKKQLS